MYLTVTFKSVSVFEVVVVEMPKSLYFILHLVFNMQYYRNRVLI